MKSTLLLKLDQKWAFLLNFDLTGFFDSDFRCILKKPVMQCSQMVWFLGLSSKSVIFWQKGLKISRRNLYHFGQNQTIFGSFCQKENPLSDRSPRSSYFLGTLHNCCLLNSSLVARLEITVSNSSVEGNTLQIPSMGSGASQLLLNEISQPICIGSLHNRLSKWLHTWWNSIIVEINLNQRIQLKQKWV